MIPVFQKRITILSRGTRGDVQPYLALALRLKEAGYRVRLVTSVSFCEFITSHGIDFYPIQSDVEQYMRNSDAGQVMMRRDMNPVRTIRLLLEYMAHDFEQAAFEFWKACQGSDAIIGHFVDSWLASPIAKKLGVPFIDTGVVPNLATRAFPYPYWPSQRTPWPGGVLGGIFNLLAARLFLRGSWLGLRPAVNQSRKNALGMPPAAAFGAIGGIEHPDCPILYGFSPHFLPRPADWPERVHVTGYWFLEPNLTAGAPPPFEPPPGLLEFLVAGPAPVYFGFGSMPSGDPEKMTALIIEALRRCGLRGLLQTGWAGLTQTDSAGDVFAIDSAPHGWLFPRMAAAVHHGGAGTTGAALRAGIPSVVIPFAGDQAFWGQRIFEQGLGPRPVPRRLLTVDLLAQAIQEATLQGSIRSRAAEMGAKIRGEDGAGRAVDVITHYLK